MLSPGLIGSTPFRNRTALNDLAGILELYHATLAETIARTTGVAVKKYPLGTPGGPDWLDALTKQHASERAALGLPGPTDFSSFDLKDAAEWASFTFLLSSDLQAIRDAAGVN
jgi:hypothetical protein